MSFSPVTLATLTAIEAVINKALSLDETSQQKLHAIDGKCIAITMNNLNIVFYVLCTAHGLYLQHRFEGDPDTALQGSVSSYIKLLTAQDKTLAILTSDIEISGDHAVAQALQSLFIDLNIDWEAQLSLITGGIVAHELSSITTSVSTWLKNTAIHFARDMQEFLDEEAPFTTPRGKVDVYLNELDNLKLRMDRLDAHLAALHDKIKK